MSQNFGINFITIVYNSSQSYQNNLSSSDSYTPFYYQCFVHATPLLLMNLQQNLPWIKYKWTMKETHRKGQRNICNSYTRLLQVFISNTIPETKGPWRLFIFKKDEHNVETRQVERALIMETVLAMLEKISLSRFNFHEVRHRKR